MILREIAEKLGMKPVTGLIRAFPGMYRRVRERSLERRDGQCQGRGPVGHAPGSPEHRGGGDAQGDCSAIIIIGGRQPEKQTLAKAEEEKIPLLLTELPAFEVVGRLYQMGISGRR